MKAFFHIPYAILSKIHLLPRLSMGWDPFVKSEELLQEHEAQGSFRAAYSPSTSTLPQPGPCAVPSLPFSAQLCVPDHHRSLLALWLLKGPSHRSHQKETRGWEKGMSFTGILSATAPLSRAGYIPP